jgi:uncharacterized protein
MDPLSGIWLALVALGAAIVNGAVGYGFSSTITPIAILWYSNKVLNPALVIVEVVVNSVLLWRERRFISRTWVRARPVVFTLFPGVVLGTIGLTYLAVNDVKVVVYLVLLPLVALQIYGFTRPFRNEVRGSASIGPGIGFLYSLTTISGPPLALFLRNQGLSKDEFRATIAQIRVAESTMTLGVYAAFTELFGAKLISAPSLGLLPFLAIPVLIGVPVGILLVRSLTPEFFRRFVMTVDGIFVSYGLSVVLVSLKWLSKTGSYVLLTALFAGVAVLSYFGLRRVRVVETADPVNAAATGFLASDAGPPPPPSDPS